ncbi:hypothetical protein TNCT_691701 [Trichonephila clavata]|uniref:Uncharacterized protein n=1 Tax=Trichonephila clavata TaxID=2740835 RepID=A0A8X6HA94_TRICU|nr:hypothetical protein TNCT_691701 [Trichonephila clavata]
MHPTDIGCTRQAMGFQLPADASQELFPPYKEIRNTKENLKDLAFLLGGSSISPFPFVRFLNPTCYLKQQSVAKSALRVFCFCFPGFEEYLEVVFFSEGFIPMGIFEYHNFDRCNE